MTFDYKIIPVRRQTIDNSYRINGFSKRRQAVSRKQKRDRRKQSRDRRSGIRDGVIVSLSSKSNRRKGNDRRKHYLSKIVV